MKTAPKDVKRRHNDHDNLSCHMLIEGEKALAIATGPDSVSILQEALIIRVASKITMPMPSGGEA